MATDFHWIGTGPYRKGSDAVTRAMSKWFVSAILLVVLVLVVTIRAADPTPSTSAPERPYVVSAVPIGAGTLDDGRPVTIWLAELSDGARMIVMFVDRGGGEQWGIGAFLPPEPKCGNAPGPLPAPMKPSWEER